MNENSSSVNRVFIMGCYFSDMNREVMKKKIIFVALSAISAWAVSGTALAQTGITQPLNIDLTATIPGTAFTNEGVAVQPAKEIHIFTAMVIDALGKTLKTKFSAKATLLLTVMDPGTHLVTVLDGTGPPVDVSGFFGFDKVSNQVESVSFDRYARAAQTNSLALETFRLQDSGGSTAMPWHFSVSGVSQTRHGGTDSRGNRIEHGFSLKAETSGTGDCEGAFAIFKGSISSEPDAGNVSLLARMPAIQRHPGSQSVIRTARGGKGGDR